MIFRLRKHEREYLRHLKAEGERRYKEVDIDVANERLRNLLERHPDLDARRIGVPPEYHDYLHFTAKIKWERWLGIGIIGFGLEAVTALAMQQDLSFMGQYVETAKEVLQYMNFGGGMAMLGGLFTSVMSRLRASSRGFATRLNDREWRFANYIFSARKSENI